VFEVVCDPEVPPLPPHITLEQARSFASAIARGDPGRRRIIAQSIRQKLPEVLHRK
jgi:pyruvate dehydrogenase (quinone)